MSTIYEYWVSVLRTFLHSLGFKGKQGTLLVVGLDNAGKTTLLHRLRTGQIRNYPPTDRPTMNEKFTCAGITFSAWDLGGHEAVRHLWSDYAPECNGLLFLMDACDAERLEEAGYELDAMLAERVIDTDAIPVAILLNKCDLPDARPTQEVCEKIQYPELLKLSSKMRIFRISVLKGEGYQEAFSWISTFL